MTRDCARDSVRLKYSLGLVSPHLVQQRRDDRSWREFSPVCISTELPLMFLVFGIFLARFFRNGYLLREVDAMVVTRYGYIVTGFVDDVTTCIRDFGNYLSNFYSHVYSATFSFSYYYISLSLFIYI